MRTRSTVFSAGRVQLFYNAGGQRFDKVLATKNFIVPKGNADYPFSMDISAAPAGTVNFVAIGTAGEGANVDSAQSKGLRASDCVPAAPTDRTAPVTEISLPPATSSGWYAAGVPVTLTATDGGSGVARTFYSVDGGPAREWTGVLEHQLGGSHTLSFWSVDVAGNVETAKSRQIDVDTAAPTITGDRAPAANAFGWNSSNVTVSFRCADDESGVAEGGCTPGTPVINEGAGQSVTGTAVDNVGRTAATTVSGINIDKTAPTLTASREPLPNAAGWNNGDVTLRWSAEDSLSGIDPESEPDDTVLTGEGADLHATATVRDKAGNQGTGSVTGVKIDRAGPAVTGAVVNDDGSRRVPNAAGWFNSRVRVRYTATDALSGVQETSGDTVLLEDGADQTATGTATDNADNSASATVTGINIDSKAPQTTADNVCTGDNGWCRGDLATVSLAAEDQSELSGVKEIRYRVNGGAEQVVRGDRATVDVPLAHGTGEATVAYYAVDNAGNVEPTTSAELRYDNIAPTVTHEVSPAANSAGWSNRDTTVRFEAEDDDAGSGVDAATVTPDVTVTEETPGREVTGSAADLAGNVGEDAVTVRLDKTNPTISAAIKGAPATRNGYHTGPVTVQFTCADALSGVVSCPADVVLNEDGADQKVTGTAVDEAGNTASTTLSGISIDSTPPAITVLGAKPSYLVGAPTGIRCTATDPTSGVDGAGCTVTVAGGTPSGVGTFTYTATATDRAGNRRTMSGTYRVLYGWTGFRQPVNDTAHQVGKGVSIFKAGSTVPVKFRLEDAAGRAVSGGAAQWLTPVQGGRLTGRPEDVRHPVPGVSGSTIRYDAGDQQYVHPWSTKGLAAGYYYRLGVRLDDGQSYFVDVGLR